MKEPPRVEIKGTGQLLFVSPSMHKDGYPYEFLEVELWSLIR